MKGTTLIELLLSLAMAMVIVVAVLTLYLHSQNNFRAQLAKNRMDNNIQIISRVLTENIRAAGNIGCARLTDDFPIKNFILSERLVTARNEITIKHASSLSSLLIKPVKNNSTLIISPPLPLSDNKENTLIISDCKHAEVFSVKKFSEQNNQQRITTTALLDDYQKNAEVAVFETKKFYLAETHRKRHDSSKIKALYFDDLRYGVNEFIEGVEEMNIDYQKELGGVAVNLKLVSPENKKVIQSLHLYIALDNL